MKFVPLIALGLLLFLQACEGQPKETIDNSPQVAKPIVQSSATIDDGEIVNRIRHIVAKQLNLDAKEIDIDAPLSKQKIAADELDVVEIIMTVEESFNIEIKDEEIGGSDIKELTKLSVRQLAELVTRKKEVK